MEEEVCECIENAPVVAQKDVHSPMTEVAPSLEDDVDEDVSIRDALREGNKDSEPLSASKLKQALRNARAKVDSAHRACTAAWGGQPISLFSEKKALARGVESWAIDIVLKSQLLVEEAANIYHLTDNYEEQIDRAFQEKRCLDRGPLVQLLERCDAESQRLQSHVELLKNAKYAYDHPEPTNLSSTSISSSSVDRNTSDAQVSSRVISGFSSSSSGSDAPVRIIRQPEKPRSLARGLFEFVVCSALDLADAAGSAMSMNQDAPTSVKEAQDSRA